jgi:flagellar biosynthesis/type III secretory pathway protein FliH
MLWPLLAALLLSTVAVPSALANPPQVTAITAESPQLFQPTQQGDYRAGFRDGYRQGHDDGMVDGKLDCKIRHQHNQFRASPQTEYDRGFADGYPKGYESGYARYCGHK